MRPVLAAALAGCFVVMLAAYVGATAYLIFRDDLMGAAVSRQISMQYAYEDRIAALRAELDRLTSRHVVQTEGVEQQVARLLAQQELIEHRQAMLGEVASRAGSAGILGADIQARAADPSPAAGQSPGGPTDGEVEPLGYVPADGEQPDPISEVFGKPQKVSLGDGSVGPLLARVRNSLDMAEDDLSARLDALSNAVDDESERLGRALAPIGVALGGAVRPDEAPEGGPFVPAPGLHFVERAALLTRTLDDIDRLRKSAVALPIGVPVKAMYQSSGFGYRKDPFLRRQAFHTGLDLVAGAGSTVRATAPGIVVSAGWNGGYGQMVEVRHAGGVSTRYGHLSKVLVTAGTKVGAGTPIGLVGSTGRSTGPHLHYETRRDGEPVNPAPYLAAGKALRRTL